MQQKTQRPVQFEITEQTRAALEAWIHRHTYGVRIVCSQAGYTAQTISPPGNTLASSKPG